MLLGYTSPKCWSRFYRHGYRSFLHLAQNSRWRLDEWHHNVNISSNMGWTLKTKERVGAWRIFLCFMILWFFLVIYVFWNQLALRKQYAWTELLRVFKRTKSFLTFLEYIFGLFSSGSGPNSIRFQDGFDVKVFRYCRHIHKYSREKLNKSTLTRNNKRETETDENENENETKNPSNTERL